MDDELFKLVRTILESNEETRKEELIRVIDILKEIAYECVNEEDGKLDPEQHKEYIDTYVPLIIRLSTEPPFKDIAKAFTKLLSFLKQELGMDIIEIEVGASYFFKNSPRVHDQQEPKTQKLLEDIFLATGRITHIEQILIWHPSFLEAYKNTKHFLMLEEGPLPLHWRNYIAILSASRHDCIYLVNQQKEMFLLNGGDPTWLKGVDNAPKKIQNLCEIISVLIHQPWMAKIKHIEFLVKGDNSWSISELVHAFVILSQFGAWAGFVYGCGISPEIDYYVQQRICNAIEEYKPEEFDIDEQRKKEFCNVNKKLADALKTVEKKEVNSEDNVQQFVKAESDSECKEESDTEPVMKKTIKLKKTCDEFKGGNKASYENFNVRSKKYTVFRFLDYSWKEHGYALVDKFYSGAAPLIDKEYEVIYNLTDKRIGESSAEDIDTTPFRNALWNYTYRLYGMCDDAFDYGKINQLLEKGIKSFVKKVACNPASITAKDFHLMGYDFSVKERVHVCLLALEAHKQSSLLYGLHAVMSYMVGK